MNIPVLIGKLSGKAKSIEWKKLLSIYSRLRFSITIVPSGVSFIKPATYPSWVVSVFLGVFATVCILIASLLMIYTPLNSLFFSKTVQLSHYQVNELHKLQDRVKFLDSELEHIKEQNQALRKAILLGDSTALKQFDHSPKTGGSILTVARQLWEEFNTDKHALQIVFRKPCEGFQSNNFRPVDAHYGVDFAVKSGTPVYASANGYVIFSDFTADDGNMVILGHADGFVSVYKHCQSLLKTTRQSVLQGEQIALSGGSGRLARGPHLHFEIWQNGVPLDPQQFIAPNERK